MSPLDRQWMRSAACNGLGKLFFSTVPADRRAAVAVCHGCPVLDQCREEACMAPPVGVVIAGTDLTLARDAGQALRELLGDTDPDQVGMRFGECIQCHAWFSQPMAGGMPARYCSDECRQARRRATTNANRAPKPPKPERVCVVCSTPYSPARDSAYCSDRCRYRAAHAAKMERRKAAPPPVVTCPVCASEFAQELGRRYCSDECRQAVKATRARKRKRKRAA